jgi:ketosteroid isomerase-like protein
MTTALLKVARPFHLLTFGNPVMRTLALLSLLPVVVLALVAQPANAASGTPAASPELSADECAVWLREMSFARSVADHDPAAFAAHLHPQAAFGSSQPKPSRGRDTIAHEWAGLIEGETVRLEWYPTRTTIGGEGDIAWSSGPALFERLVPGPQPQYAISHFRSVWHRGDDGQWYVLFDDGTAPRAATEAEAAAFRAARPTGCPQTNAG